MQVTIHQPDFLPWVGFFHKWAVSDLFIIYDDAQFIKGGWQNRDKIQVEDSGLWLTVPVITKGRLGQKINEVEINNNVKWKHKILNTFQANFAKSKNFKKFFPEIESIINKENIFLFNLNNDLIFWIGEKLNINVPVKYSSEFKSSLKSSERLIDLLKKNNATEYYTGKTSELYLNQELFRSNKIKIKYQDLSEISGIFPISSNNLGYSVIQYLFEEF